MDQEVQSILPEEPKGPEFSKKVKKPKGRPKNENYLPWPEARKFMRDELIPSRAKYHEWWDRNKPKAVPRFPYRVYKEWVSWNDFLGTDNKFHDRVTIKWRPLEEATLWVHSLKLTSYNEWMEYCRTYDIPPDIPKRPELSYDTWKSWSHWLGNKPVEALEAKQEAAQKIQIFYIIHEQGVPENVLTYGVEPNGIAVLKQRWEREHFTVIKLFWYDPLRQAVIKQLMETQTTSYLGLTHQRIMPNVWEIIWQLQQQLETIHSV